MQKLISVIFCGKKVKKATLLGFLKGAGVSGANNINPR